MGPPSPFESLGERGEGEGGIGSGGEGGSLAMGCGGVGSSRVGVVAPPEVGGGEVVSDNYYTVLRMLKQADADRARESLRADDLAREMEEREVGWAVEREGLKREGLEARKKLRRMEGESGYAEVFEMYEAEISSLRAELASKEERLVEVEAAWREAAIRRGGGGGGEEGEEGGGRSARVRGWKKALAASEKEKASLRSEVGEMGRRMRQAEVHRRAHEDMTRKMLRLNRERERGSQEVTELQLALSEVNARNEALVGALREAEGRGERGEREREEMSEELQALRKANAKLE
ncbi:MAG: hypothetical protein SGPRY_010521 [Prymnesium sp.]